MDIHLTYEIPVTRDVAFDLFSRQVARWWPIAMTHPGWEDATVELPPEIGADVACRGDGGPRLCGRVTQVQPGELLEWQSWFRQRPEKATTIRVHFLDVEYGTRVVFEHVGWGAHNESHRDRFNDWPLILWHFVSFARNHHSRLSRHV